MLSSDSASERVVVMAPLWLGFAALAAAMMVPSWRRQPLTATPALFTVVPWLPVPLPPIALVWTGPLAWVPIGCAILAAIVLPAVSDRAATADRARVFSARRDALLAGVLTCAVSIAIAMVLAPRLPSGDEPHYLVITQSLLLDGDLEISNNHDARDYTAYFPGDLRPDFLKRGARGEIYSIHAPGIAALVLPAFAVAGYRGAQLTIVLAAALTGALIWWMAWRAGDDRRAAWVAWLAIVMTPTFLIQSVTIFPDGPGALVTAASVWLLMRLHDRASPPATRAIVTVAVLIAAWPWMHTRFAALAAVFGAAILYRLATAGVPARVRRLAAFAAVPVVSAVAWFGYFYALYGTFDPTAPYGAPAGDRSAAFAPGGIAGLLFDQQFGIVAFAPVLLAALAGAVLAFRSRWRTVAAWSVAAAGAYLLVTGTYWMWWGGVPAPPARFVTVILPVAAIPLALVWRRSAQTLRSVVLIALAWSVATTIYVVTYGRGELAWSVRSGQAPWLESLGPVVNLPRGWPSFFWRITPGVVSSEWPFAVHVALWLTTIAVVVAATVLAARAAREPARPAIAGCGILAAVMLFVQVGWVVNGVNGLDPARSQLRVLEASARGTRLSILNAFSVRDGAEAPGLMTVRAEEPPRFQQNPPLAVFHRVPKGTYDVLISLRRPRSGVLVARDGAREIARLPFVSLSEQRVALPLPQGAAVLILEMEGEMRTEAGVALRRQ